MEIVHLIADGEAVTSCCGRTPFELPRTDRITVDPSLAGGCERHCSCPDPLNGLQDLACLIHGRRAFESGEL
jgi:hypothetical protein